MQKLKAVSVCVCVFFLASVIYFIICCVDFIAAQNRGKKSNLMPIAVNIQWGCLLFLLLTFPNVISLTTTLFLYHYYVSNICWNLHKIRRKCVIEKKMRISKVGECEPVFDTGG